jgi:N-acetylmuramoyl-L-alanine amidase
LFRIKTEGGPSCRDASYQLRRHAAGKENFMYEISSKHRLSGPKCTYNGTGVHSTGRVIAPQFVVLHYTVIDYASTIRTFGPNGPRKASAHLVVSRSGEITQMVDFNLRAWHAGESVWEGAIDLNSRSIGIELENHGFLSQRADGNYISDNGDRVRPESVVIAHHKHPGWRSTFWEQYDPDQLDACEELCHTLVDHYHLKGILGHDDIAPGRKADPGPAFPMARMHGAFGRENATQRQRLVVATDLLNIRVGAGTNYILAGAALRKGTVVEVLEHEESGWSKVVCQNQSSTGWVFARYLSDAPFSTM